MSKINESNEAWKDTAQLFVETFKNNWDVPFVVEAASGRSLSHKDFFFCALNAERVLQDLKIQKNDIVCLISQNSLHLMVLYFALLLKGAVVVPIDPEKGTEEINAILSQLSYRCIIAGAGVEKIGASHKNIILLDSISALFYRSENKGEPSSLSVFENVDYNAPYIMTFTSGSTGAPKGVIHSCRNLAMSAQAFSERFHFGPQNVFYHNLPMTYMAGILNSIFLPFFSGSKIVIGERFRVSEVARFWEAPERYKVNTFWFIPTIIALLLKLDRSEKKAPLASNGPIVGCVGTSPLLPRMKEEFEAKYNIPLFESYGLSETLFNTTNSPFDAFAPGVGKALRGVELDFGDDQEIYIGVPWMFLGYHAADRGSSMKGEKFISGDLGELQSSGSLLITGRKKNIIKRGGITISPESIDSFVDKLDLVDGGTAIGVADDILGEKNVFFYVGKPNSSPTVEHVINGQIIEHLGQSFRVDQFVRLDELPYTTNGKIDKVRLKVMYAQKEYDTKN